MPLFGFSKFTLDLVTFLQTSLIAGHFDQGCLDLFVGILFSAGAFQMNGGVQPTVLQTEMVIAIVIAFICCISVHRKTLFQITIH